MLIKDPLKYNKIIMILLIIFILAVGFIFITLAIDDYIEVSGEIKPLVYQIVTAEIPGTIKKVYYHDGDLVKEGDLLLELKDDDFRYLLSINNKKMDSIIQKKTNDLNKNASSIKEYDDEIEILMMESNNLMDKLNKCKVYSKVSGILFEDNKDPKEGLYFKEGNEIQKIFSVSEIYAEVFIPEKDYSKIKVNQKVKLFINALPYEKYKVFSGKVSLLNIHKVDKYQNGFTGMVLISDPDFVEKGGSVKRKLFFGLTLQARIYIEKKRFLERFLQ